MFIHINQRIAVALLIVLTLFAVLGTKLTGRHAAQSETSQKNNLTVHEWGTFTSVARGDGGPQYWNPLSGPSELPDFVYRGKVVASNQQCVKCNLALVRMETPVLYFYTDRETSVSVKVDFPKGTISEWYPQARDTDSGIDWGRLNILPGAQVSFPVAQRESHYYPARETDAAPVRTSNKGKTEYEKFLFYRGIGNFDPPLRAGLAGDKVTVKNPGTEEIAQVIVFENRGGKAGWRIGGQLKGEATFDRPVPDQPIESLHRELERILVAQGLYEKEAAAMVKTWRDSWFEDGLRVFYIVPCRATDAILPITISPAPSQLTRVLVGRAEIITPEMEKAIQAAVTQFGGDSPDARAAAINTVRRYGRFAEPVLRNLMAAGGVTERISQLMTMATTKPTGGSN
ncbi:MAG TPA: hypothetical protein VFD58_33995 [Blastocatellia bacterium]|nr:hypothetical protein [Blastocatellia bacterium]